MSHPEIVVKSDGQIDVLPKHVPAGPVFYAKKITALVVFGVLLGLLVRYVNGCTTFWGGFLIWGVVTRVIKSLIIAGFLLSCLTAAARRVIRILTSHVRPWLNAQPVLARRLSKVLGAVTAEVGQG